MKKILFLLLAALIITGGFIATRLTRKLARPSDEFSYKKLLQQQRSKAGQDTSNLQLGVWYKNSLIYTLDIKMFKDSDGDGTGNIKGLVSKLDYIKSLRTGIIWPPPFFPSPLQDDGYDIAITIKLTQGLVAWRILNNL